MNLDTGICSIYKLENKARAGGKPDIQIVIPAISEPWYGELDFESNPKYVTEMQEDVEIASRIRVLQDKRINRQTVVTLADGKQYKVERAYHGKDEESGELITDISLSRVVSEYDITTV